MVGYSTATQGFNEFLATKWLTLGTDGRRIDDSLRIGYRLSMSRYILLPPRWSAHMEFAVGWDPALETYFAQVMDHSLNRDDDGVIVWLGAMPPHYHDIDELMCAVNDQIRDMLPEIRLTKTMRAEVDEGFQDRHERQRTA